MEEERFENYYKLPSIILEIMNWLCDTKFYKKTYEERKEGYEEIPLSENWKFVDFIIDIGDFENIKAIRIGEIPKYKGDHEKSLYINFVVPATCCLYRGYATGLYASKVIKKSYPIPRYMKEELYEFIKMHNQKVNLWKKI